MSGSENKPSHRIERVQRELRELSSKYFIQSGRLFGNSLITVSRTEVSKDLRHAKVFLSLLGATKRDSDEDFVDIKKFEPELGRFIGKHLKTKYSPKVTLVFDRGIEVMSSINSKINEVVGDGEEE